MTIHNTRYYHIRRRRVSLAEAYSLISKNFHIAYTNENEQSSIEAKLGHGGVEVDKIAILPNPRNLKSWLVFERNGHSTAIPDVWFGDDISGPTQRTGS